MDAPEDPTYSYRVFGLVIRSTIPLPSCAPGEGLPDVEVDYGPVAFARPDPPSQHPLVHCSADEAIFFWDFVGALSVRNGRRITVDPLPGAEADVVAQAVEGVGMGALLHQRGLFTLHASAVAIGDGVAAFIGVKGAGKSTTAASLYARGYPLVTDDLAPILLEGEPAQAFVLPGTNAFKLWPQAAAASLGDDPAALNELYRNAVKRHRPAEPFARSGAQPLTAIYVLGYVESDAPRVSIEPLSPQQACLELFRHANAQRLLGAAAGFTDLLQRCAHVTRCVPVRALSRRASLDELGLLVDAIERDVQEIRAGIVA